MFSVDLTLLSGAKLSKKLVAKVYLLLPITWSARVITCVISPASKDGEALFLRASVWREFAEHVAGSLTKGSRVIATGRLKQRSYETKEGEKRTSIELEVDEIGPSLRYATAQVTRAASSRDGGGAGGGRGNAVADEPWAASAPDAPAGDVWNTPGSYSDETPF